MIVIKLGKWLSYGATFFHYKRLYYKGKWTPFCKVTLRKNGKYKYYGSVSISDAITIDDIDCYVRCEKE